MREQLSSVVSQVSVMIKKKSKLLVVIKLRHIKYLLFKGPSDTVSSGEWRRMLVDLDQTVIISGIGSWRMSTVLKRLTKDGDGNSTQIGESRDRRMENGKRRWENWIWVSSG